MNRKIQIESRYTDAEESQRVVVGTNRDVIKSNGGKWLWLSW